VVVLSHDLDQVSSRGRVAAKSDQELAQASQFVAEDSLRHGRLPGHRQVEEKEAGENAPTI
jgi:hypothetical protein